MTQMDDATQTALVDQLTDMVHTVAPDANLRPMYGGIVIELVPDHPKSRIGGFYTYDAYVSFEFAQGVQLEDPAALLEGKGTYRRHLKLRSLDDVTAKSCHAFLQQAVDLAVATGFEPATPG